MLLLLETLSKSNHKVFPGILFIIFISTQVVEFVSQRDFLKTGGMMWQWGGHTGTGGS